MTSTVNGCGTAHCGNERILHKSNIEYFETIYPDLKDKNYEYYLTTESIVLIFVPIIPLETYIFCYTETGILNSKYSVLYYPCGKGKVCWDHVKRSLSFYIFPALGIIFIIWSIINYISNLLHLVGYL